MRLRKPIIEFVVVVGICFILLLYSIPRFLKNQKMAKVQELHEALHYAAVEFEKQYANQRTLSATLLDDSNQFVSYGGKHDFLDGSYVIQLKKENIKELVRSPTPESREPVRFYAILHLVNQEPSHEMRIVNFCVFGYLNEKRARYVKDSAMDFIIPHTPLEIASVKNVNGDVVAEPNSLLLFNPEYDPFDESIIYIDSDDLGWKIPVPQVNSTGDTHED